MTILEKFEMQVGEELDFDLDCNEWLADKGDSIATVSANVIGSGVQLGVTDFPVGGGAVSHLGGVIKVWVTGAVNRQKSIVEYSFKTVGGRRKEAEIQITTKETP